jgi:enterochelin esterase-like enzyme
MATLAAFVTAALLPGFFPVAQGPGGGQVLQGTFPGTQRPGDIYLPPGFSAPTRYPVVYLLHGMPGSPSEYVVGTQLATFADGAIGRGTVRPFIAVMPAAGSTPRYNGEWAGSWEQGLVSSVVPWVDGHLPTRPNAAGRVIAGLSAGGYGAVDIGLRHPALFQTIESWSGYFTPPRDGPFTNATSAMLAAHDPTRLVVAERTLLARAKTRFFVSTGPPHSHWAPPVATVDYGRELRSVGLPYTLRVYTSHQGQWSRQLADGLLWAFAPRRI